MRQYLRGVRRCRDLAIVHLMPLPESLRRLLARYVELERPEESNSRALFVVLKGRQRGAPMTAAGLRSLFRYRRRVSELHNANAHRFRHTFGTDMARAGVRLPTLQKMMGHAQAETTLQYINLAMTDIAAEYARASSVIHSRYRARSEGWLACRLSVSVRRSNSQGTH